MLDVASLQHFDFFSKFKLYAGSKGLYRNISNVVILDHEGYEGNYSDFHEGDFVITNLFFAKDHPELIYSSFLQLVKIGISTLAIKSLYFQNLPKNVVQLAEETNIPIFFFNSIYIEDVILTINDYLRSSTNYNYYESLVDSLIQLKIDDTAMNKLLTVFVGKHHSYVSSMYISFLTQKDDVSIQKFLIRILHKKNSLIYNKDLFCLKYKNGILFLYFYSELFDTKKVNQNWENVFYDLEINSLNFNIGINDELILINKIDVSIQGSIYANECCLNNDRKKRHKDLKLNNIIKPLAQNRYVEEYLSNVCKTIKSYEPQQNNELMKTLNAYVNCNCNIMQTAKILFQHPNTIRYRLNKIKSIISCENDIEFQIIVVLMINLFN